MKEKIIEYLKICDKYASTLDSDVERYADEIMLLVNQEVERRIAETIAGKFIEVEIEKRIKERMPSEEESKKEADELFEGTNREFRKGMYSGFLFGIQWLRSRMTPQVTPQVPRKTEGGGE